MAPPLGDHLRQDRCHGVENPLDVDLHHGRPVLHLQFREVPCGHHPCVGKEGIDLPKPFPGQGDQGLHILPAGDV